MEEIFSTCQVVSNHLANNASTVGTLKGVHFASMLPYATFINTDRGVPVVEEFQRYGAGESTHYEVSMKMLETMA